MHLKSLVAVGLAVGLVGCGSTSPTAPTAVQSSASVPDPTPSPTPSPTPTPTPTPTPKVNLITGVVQDALGRPVVDVKVSAGAGSSDDTDAEGRFAVTTSAPIGASVHFTVYKEGYKYKELFVTGPTVVITLYVRGDGDTTPDPDWPEPCVLWGEC